MNKSLFVTEKPSVAMEFVKILDIKGIKRDGYIEGNDTIFTWCVGHMITMSYPEAYDEKLKYWSLSTIPFLPEDYRYEIIPSVAKQFNIVKSLLLREDVDTIYVCTDSGREGEYIYRLVDMMSGVENKIKKRVWIDSQTEEEIKKGIKEAKELSEYDSLSAAAYLRAKEDYLLGINFSRLLTLIYGKTLSNIIGEDKIVIAVGRVMSCVLGMVVDRELEMRNFDKISFYKILAKLKANDNMFYEGEWKAVEGSKYFESIALYNDNGFKKEKHAEELKKELEDYSIKNLAIIDKVSKQKELKYAPLLFNLAELQNQCSKQFKISPDETLKIIQSLYERKLLTYPRTDARVLSKAVAKEIEKNIRKLINFRGESEISGIASKIIEDNSYKNLEKTKYVDDSKITDHYAIIPTGEGFDNYNGLKKIEKEIFNLVVRRFLAIFYPPAKFNKISIVTKIQNESFFTNNKVCVERGYLDILKGEGDVNESEEKAVEFLNTLKKGQKIEVEDLELKEGKTSPPKRYTSGSIIIAMENAGKLIEDDQLREQIKGSGIGTSATRAEILKKLDRIGYININNGTQVITPTIKGEVIYRTIKNSIPSLLNPVLTASWEKGLGLVVREEISSNEFMAKLEEYIKRNVYNVINNNGIIDSQYLISSIQNKESVNMNKMDEVLGICPICKNGRVIKNSKGYGCDNWKSGCEFFVGEICGVKIPVIEIKKLLRNGTTNLIEGFKSQKGNVFGARLILKNNKIELSFK